MSVEETKKELQEILASSQSKAILRGPKVAHMSPETIAALESASFLEDIRDLLREHLKAAPKGGR